MDYLACLKDYCIDQLFNSRLYAYTGSNPILAEKKRFFEALFCNDIFVEGNQLNEAYYRQYQGTLKDVYYELYRFVSKDGFLANLQQSASYLKTLNDAIQFLTILNVHFRWRRAEAFDGKPISLFDKNYCEYIDDAAYSENTPQEIITGRFRERIGYQFNFNYILRYDASLDKSYFKQFLSVLKSSERPYNGILLFTEDTLYSFCNYIKHGRRYTHFKYDYDILNRYAYIEFKEVTKKGQMIVTYNYTIVFRQDAPGSLFELIYFKITSQTFDMVTQEEFDTKVNYYCIYFPYKKMGPDDKFNSPDHIDVFT